MLYANQKADTLEAQRTRVCVYIITILFNILPLDLLPQSSPFSYFLKTGRATLYCELYQPKENHVGLSIYVQRLVT